MLIIKGFAMALTREFLNFFYLCNSLRMSPMKSEVQQSSQLQTRALATKPATNQGINYKTTTLLDMKSSSAKIFYEKVLKICIWPEHS